jgi:rRNA maturation protein Nop10
MHKDAAVDAFMNTEPAPYTPMERYRIKNNHLDGEPEPKEQPKRSVFGKLGDLFPKLSLGDNKTQADLPPPQSMADKYGRE